MYNILLYYYIHLPILYLSRVAKHVTISSFGFHALLVNCNSHGTLYRVYFVQLLWLPIVTTFKDHF